MFVLMFTAEALVKIFAQGFALGHPSCYIRSHWNKLDFVVVCESCGTLGMSFLASSGAGAKRPDWVPDTSMLRLARLLRPLRTLKFIPVRRVGKF